jgi:hypothetical protein
MILQSNPLLRTQLRGLLVRAAAASYELAMTALPVWLLFRNHDMLSALWPTWITIALSASLIAAMCQPRLQAWWYRLAAALAAMMAAVWANGSTPAAWFGSALLAAGIFQGSTVPNRSGKAWWPWIGVVCYLVASIVAHTQEEWKSLTSLLTLLGTISLTAALAITHERQLRSITLSERAAQRIPPAMRLHSRIYAIVLILGMLAMAAGLGSMVILAIREAVVWAVSLFSALLKVLHLEVVSNEGPPPQTPLLSPVQTEPTLLSRLLDMLFYGIGALIGAVLLYWGLNRLYHSRRDWWNRLASFWHRIWRIKPQSRQQPPGYTDEETSLFSWEESLAHLRRKRSERTRFRRREPGYEDMPDNRKKVRYLYRKWLRQLKSGGFDAPPHMTPAEIMLAAKAWLTDPRRREDASRTAAGSFRKLRRKPAFFHDRQIAELIELYYQVRYRGIEPTDAQVEQIRQGSEMREP